MFLTRPTTKHSNIKIYTSTRPRCNAVWTSFRKAMDLDIFLSFSGLASADWAVAFILSLTASRTVDTGIPSLIS
uniref:Uncharacterized protein n=1 Tax=Aegilops tauschii subsp. strangulata TaxID=200361 RepID=A0A453B0Y1_AEGTS